MVRERTGWGVRLWLFFFPFFFYMESKEGGRGEGERGQRWLAYLVEYEGLQSRAFGMARLGLFARRPLCGRFRSPRLLVFAWTLLGYSRPLPYLVMSVRED